MSPLAPTIESLFLRELRTLRKELEAYPDDASVWALPPALPNSAGTLILHLAGNLQHYVGALLGGSGYIRDRPAEFATRGMTKAALAAQITAAEEAIRATMPRLTEAQLSAPFPEAIRDHQLETGEFLVHLAVHLGYHLGQVNYHRRAVTGDGRGFGALAAAELSTAARP